MLAALGAAGWGSSTSRRAIPTWRTCSWPDAGRRGLSGRFDVLIIGSGAAGLTAALKLAPTRKVAVIAKGALGEGATDWAQGGIAAVLEEGDSFDAHVNDTMDRRRGPQQSRCGRACRRAAPAAIARLAELGVPFNLDRATGTAGI